MAHSRLRQAVNNLDNSQTPLDPLQKNKKPAKVPSEVREQHKISSQTPNVRQNG